VSRLLLDARRMLAKHVHRAGCRKCRAAVAEATVSWRVKSRKWEV
jgi:hypothetical protein